MYLLLYMFAMNFTRKMAFVVLVVFTIQFAPHQHVEACVPESYPKGGSTVVCGLGK